MGAASILYGCCKDTVKHFGHMVPSEIPRESIASCSWSCCAAALRCVQTESSKRMAKLERKHRRGGGRTTPEGGGELHSLLTAA